MKINLTHKIDEDRRKIIDQFKRIGFKQEDVGLVLKEINLDVVDEVHDYDSDSDTLKLPIKLYPDILYYYQNNEIHTVIWIACEFIDTSEEGLDILTDYVKKNILKNDEFALKPFKDEDAYKLYFSKPKEDRHGYIKTAFYLNPDYPNGYWDNHTIE